MTMTGQSGPNDLEFQFAVMLGILAGDTFETVASDLPELSYMNMPEPVVDEMPEDVMEVSDGN